ncbi:MAG: ABC transporter permease [Bacteroides sp.]|nr:ABC transporter permease [Bacteroides sp.]
MIQYYLKIAVRHLWKYKVQNLISIIGLAVCLLCFSLCMYCSRFFLSIDQGFENCDRIADVMLRTPDDDVISGTPATLVEELRGIPLSEVEALTFLTYSRHRLYNIEMEDGKERPFEDMGTIETDSCFYRVFTPEVIAGSWEVAVRTPNAIVMTESVMRKAFGEAGNPIGKRMVLTRRLFTSPDTTPRSGGIAYTIQAVIRDIPENNSLNNCSGIDLLVLNDSEGLLQSNSRKNMTGGSTFALLHKGKTVQQLEARFRSLRLTNDLFRQDNPVCATSFGKTYWDTSAIPYFVYVTATLGVLILLAGLLNFFHFLTGSFLNRSREYSLHKVLGSNSRQLLSQLFVQSALVILLAFLLNFCMIEILAPYLHLTLGNYSLIIAKEPLMGQYSEYLALIFLLNVFICMMAVAYTQRISIQEGIKGNNKYTGKHRLRNVMMGVQFFICWIFVTLTAALYLQAEKTTSTLFGTLSKHEKESILSIAVDYSFLKNEEKLALIERFASHSGVQEKLLADISYSNGVSGTGLQLEKDNSNSGFEVNVMSTAPNFFHFMNMPILKGHTLQNNGEMVVDETLEKRMKKELLGTVLYNYADGYTVNGISAPFVADVYNRSEGFAFLPGNFKVYVGHCYLKCYPKQINAVKEHVLKVLHEALPYTLSPKITTLQQDLEEEQGLETKLKSIVFFFAAVSIIITLLGVYSAITLDTERRRKEVAIRKVNGAGLRQIFLLFIRMYAWILIITAVIAFPLLYAVLQLWRRMYTVFFNNGMCFWCGIFVIISLITIVTVIFRILKIARINPAEVIKTE